MVLLYSLNGGFARGITTRKVKPLRRPPKREVFLCLKQRKACPSEALAKEGGEKMTERITHTPQTARKQAVQEAMTIINRDKVVGGRSLMQFDQNSGKSEIILGLTGLDHADIPTPVGTIQALRLPASDRHPNWVNGSVIVDLRETGVRGTREKRNLTRQVPIGEDGIGAMQINKRTMLWVAVSEAAPQGDIPESV